MARVPVSNTRDEEIRELIRLGHDLEEIATIMGVTVDYVCDIADAM